MYVDKRCFFLVRLPENLGGRLLHYKLKKTHCILDEMAAMYECLYVDCISLYRYICMSHCVHSIQTNVCVPLYSAKGILDVALNTK